MENLVEARVLEGRVSEKRRFGGGAWRDGMAVWQGRRSLPLAVVAVLMACLAPGCAPQAPAQSPTRGQVTTAGKATATTPDPRLAPALAALAAAEGELGAAASARLRAGIGSKSGAFLDLLATVLAERSLDPGRFLRVDKIAPPLAPELEPRDLVSLDGTGLHVSRAGHRLRRAAFEAFSSMSAAARQAGVDLLVSSSYRSYAYQKEVFARAVASDGEAEARRASAEPGRSQHQLGTALDLGSIDDSFAKTPAFAWLAKHAADYGFSLSYPESMDTVTGYRPESWHWRWLGREAVKLQRDFFGDIQQWMIVYLSYYH
jgi:D-alanyl-D-alanine carboxypeptidase